MKESDPGTGWAGAGNRGPAAAFGLLRVSGALGGSRRSPGLDSGRPAGSHLPQPRRRESSRSHLNLLEGSEAGGENFLSELSEAFAPPQALPPTPSGRPKSGGFGRFVYREHRKLKKSLRPFSRLRNVQTPSAPGGGEATRTQGSRCRRSGRPQPPPSCAPAGARREGRFFSDLVCRGEMWLYQSTNIYS